MPDEPDLGSLSDNALAAEISRLQALIDLNEAQIESDDAVKKSGRGVLPAEHS